VVEINHSTARVRLSSSYKNVASSHPCYPPRPGPYLRVCRNCASFLLRESQHGWAGPYSVGALWFVWPAVDDGWKIEMGMKSAPKCKLWLILFTEGSLELWAVENAVFTSILMVWFCGSRLLYQGKVKGEEDRNKSKRIFVYKKSFCTQVKGFFYAFVLRWNATSTKSIFLLGKRAYSSLQLVPPIVKISFGIPRPL